MIRWPPAIVLALAAFSCSESTRPPTGPDPPPLTGIAGCGLGPVPLRTTEPEACTNFVTSCPLPRPTGVLTVVAASTCIFRAGEAGCEPLPEIGCPTLTGKSVHMTLINPVRDATRTCFSGGEFAFRIQPTENGGAEFGWHAWERDPVTCRDTGEEREGTGVVSGPCCAQVVDIPYPAGGWTLRFSVRTDWQR